MSSCGSSEGGNSPRQHYRICVFKSRCCKVFQKLALIYKSVLNYQTSPFFMMADGREGVHMKGKTRDLFLV